MHRLMISSLRWPYVVAAVLLFLPVLAPLTYVLQDGIRRSTAAEIAGSQAFWLTLGLATIFWSGWIAMLVVPALRPRRLILTYDGLTLKTPWRTKYWPWQSVLGVWSLGGYKPQLEIIAEDGTKRRVFLGSYWPGDTIGVAAVIDSFKQSIVALALDTSPTLNESPAMAA